MNDLKCPTCGNTANIVGVEYVMTPVDYDGVSEFQCPCGTRWGRWSGKLLHDGQLEGRYGAGTPVIDLVAPRHGK
jgi:hypothetical protein